LHEDGKTRSYVIGYQDGSKWVWETVKADYADAKAERSRRTDKRNERLASGPKVTPHDATFAAEMLTGCLVRGRRRRARRHEQEHHEAIYTQAFNRAQREERIRKAMGEAMGGKW
jgi:hypothetical protein